MSMATDALTIFRSMGSTSLYCPLQILKNISTQT